MPDRTRGVPVSSAAPFATGLALDALLGPRDDLEARHRNPVAARHAQSEGALGQQFERPVDLVDGLARGGRQREIALAFDAHRVAFARLLVELGVTLLAILGKLFGLG